MTFVPRLLIFETLPTTMLEAKARALSGAAEGTTIVARAQTSGRGRHGRRWIAEPDTGMWMTTILRPPQARSKNFSELSLVTGIAVCDAVYAMGVRDAKLKWPNDVLVGDKKLAGILLENDSGTVLAGIGVNVTPLAARTLPDDVADRYTGLFDHIDRGTLKSSQDPTLSSMSVGILAVLDSLATWYDRWVREGFEALIADYERYDALQGSDVRIVTTEGATVVGCARGVNALGELVVATSQGTTQVRAGEVERVRR